MTSRTHYDVLGVAREATADEVRAAYRTLARDRHPDAGGDAAAMRRLNAAWHVLGDPSRRRAYDRMLANGESGADGDGGARRGGRSDAEWVDVDVDPSTDDLADLMDLADDRPLGETMALSGWSAIMPPGTLAAAGVTMAGGVYFMSPPLVALGVGLLILALGLFVLAPLRAMARRPPPDGDDDRGGQ